MAATRKGTCKDCGLGRIYRVILVPGGQVKLKCNNCQTETVVVEGPEK